MSIGEKVKTVADNLESIYGKGKAIGYSNGYSVGYDEGHYDGSISTIGYCHSMHFKQSFLGNGQNELEIAIPFKPDLITINTCHPYSSEMPNCIRGITADMRGCGRHMGNVLLCDENGTTRSVLLMSDMSGKYFSYENDKFCCRFHVQGYEKIQWMTNVRYNVMAVRYFEENGKELIEEQIYMLPYEPPEGSSGTLTYYRDVIYTYFTQEEWEKLTSVRSNWTFVLR